MAFSGVPKITLEQWRAFQAVVDHGGYAQAAEAIHKSQSTLSYSVQKIEQLLGVKLLAVKGRKAELTSAGEVMLRRSRQLLDSATQLESVAERLALGIEARIALGVDVVFPYDDLLCVLARFSQQYPDTRVELMETVLSGGHDQLLGGAVDLLVTAIVPPGFTGEPLMRLSFTCVASPAHALHGLGREATLQDLKHHRQVVTRDSGVQRRLSAPWLEAEQRWTVTNLTTAIRALKQGLGFAWVPTLQIQRELSLGELVAVPLDQGGIRYGQLYLVYNDRDGAGPATRYLTQLLIDTCTELEINAASASGLPVD